MECTCLQAVTKIMRDPTVVKDLVRLNGINSETAQKMLQDLQADVQQCVDCDQVYSPQADAKRLQLGKPLHALATAYALFILCSRKGPHTGKLLGIVWHHVFCWSFSYVLHCVTDKHATG